MRLNPGFRLDPYEIVLPLGVGGMGEVYRARDTKLGRDVALKIPPEAFAADAERIGRFEREAKLLASLNHPNIAAIYGFEDSGEVRALVMELVEGVTLAERLAKGPIPLDDALAISKQLCEGLEYAHERGIVHRDLKPANVKITPDGKVKILDFGLAKALEGEAVAGDPSLSPTVSHLATHAGIILGTAAYMAPDQAKGKVVDRRADIWAFGCVIFEMLTGKQAFSGETVTDVLASLVKDEPDWGRLPARTPGRLRELLIRCLRKDPRQRLQSIGEARIAIEEILSGASQAPTFLAGPPEPQSRALASKVVLPWVLVAVLSIIVAIVAVAYLRSTMRGPDASYVTTLDVSPPEGVASAPRDSTGLALSPDGRRLVFMGAKGGVEQLYLRSMDQAEAKPMAGTEGAASPFFSPDGQWIGFFADGKLEKISVGGGAPLILCDSPNQRGGTWASDGTIIFSPDFASGLMRVSAAGGKPQPLISPDAAKGERTYRWPDVLPNRKGVIFTIGSAGKPASYDDAEIAVYSFETRQIRTLTHAGMARYSPSGYLICSRAGTLSAIAFDQERLEGAGEPIQLSQSVAGDPSSGTGYFAISAGGTMAYLRGSANLLNTVLVLVDRKGEPKVLPLPPRQYNTPRFSPDGKRLALAIGDMSGGQSDIWTYDLGTGNLNRLTFNSDNSYPLWSPDGSQIAFESTRDREGIYVKHADGSGAEQGLLTTQVNPIQPDAWSPNGQLIAFTRRSSTGGDLGTLAAGGGGPQSTFQTNAFGATFSPDSNFIAYSSFQAGKYQVFVKAYPGAAGEWQVSVDNGSYPKWRRDGKEILYYDYERNRIMVVEVQTRPSFHADSPRVLFNLPPFQYIMQTTPAVNFDVSPDGQKFAFVRLSGAVQAPSVSVVMNFPAEIRALTGK